jgi:predicted dehydrogenase
VSPFRVGIIGTGRIASEFEDSMPEKPCSISGAFSMHPECVVVAGCNRGRERLEKFGKRWGVRALYQDCGEMLEGERLDIVAVATPPGLHRDQVVMAAESGVKGIFCEKPMALSLGECDDMIAACRANGVKLLVNCTRRWGGGYQAIREAAQEGRWGRLLHMVGFCQGCKPVPEWEAEFEGPMLHDAVHMYDLMRFFAGDVQWVLGTASRRIRDDLRVEDSALSILQFDSGIQGVTVVDELTEYSRFELELHFERGLVRVGAGFSAQKSVSAGLDETWWYDLAEDSVPEAAWEGAGILHAVRDLVDAIENGGDTRSTGEDGRAAIEIIMALYESERRGHQKVHLPLDEPRRMLDVMREEGIY